MDASSDFQDTLPLSSDSLLAQMDDWGLTYRLHTHMPLRTVEDAKSVEDQFVVSGENTLCLKNLYLRDRKKRNYLVSLEQSRQIDLKQLGNQLGVGGLSFGSPERLLQHLGIRPGAVSPLAMINGVKSNVFFLMDATAQRADVINMHPLVNDRTVAMPRPDLMAFFDRVGCEVTWLP
ncbi:prolyl-tRNA synthetase associated domain-containing protein [Ruegeria arenilitoris]|uniref:prolyl-tRNA synthetase associated domain-containing protein n=1 Tax=Ruegeria arenilitoris TaxID=1173585 RepID=UPI00147A26A1|nr:prolyl-tRNA synthetase associated domain-containing protein [Ruegeria arenilitoris]